MKKRLVISALLLAAGLAVSPSAVAQPQITTTTLADGVYVVHTNAPIPMPGGEPFNMNDLLLVGPETALLVDTLFPGPYPRFINVVHGLTGGLPVDTLINTHWHFDHVGLNREFRLAERTGNVIAHLAAGELMARYPCANDVPGTCWTPFTDPAYQPTLGLDGQMIQAVGDEQVVLKTFEHAHSGADLMVFLRHANVVATGDIYFGGMYPIIDRAGGGTINGMIAALQHLLAQIDENTVVVPSHGTVGNRESVEEFVDMLKTSRMIVRWLMAWHLTEEQIMAHPWFAALDAKWGKGFISGPLFRRILYRDMAPEGR
jgi:glyoxylase-like metal-dependent hydrolase (beta-lactamase superfamily II)